MSSTTLIPSVSSRLKALRATGLLDAPTDPGFDRITKLMTMSLGVPVALISLVDEDRQFFSSQCGLPEPWASQRETPLSHSFCQHVVESREPLIVADAREHVLVRDNLAIRDLSVVAYAGVPIVDVDGHVLGSLCAIDTKPREWSKTDMELLTALSAQVTADVHARVISLVLTEEIHKHRIAADHSTVRVDVGEIRTLANALLLGLDQIRQLGPTSVEQSVYLSLCRRNGERLLAAIERAEITE